MRQYRKSVMKTRHSQYTLPAGYGGSPALLTYHLLRYGADSSAFCCHTGLRPIDDWNSIVVVEAREREIEILLNAPYLRIRPAPGSADFSWPKLDAGAKAGLRAMLKKGLYLCDAIQDMGARAAVELHHEKRNSDSIAVRTRRLQVAFIEKLPGEDLISLYTLCRIAAESWHGVNMMPAHVFGNPMSSVFEKELVFKETLLRFGSWFLFGEVRGYGPRSYHRRQLLDETHKEAINPSYSSPHSPPIQKESALVATMNHELHMRFKVRVRDLDSKVLPMVEEVIGATKPAFKDPPSQRGHGSAAAV